MFQGFDSLMVLQLCMLSKSHDNSSGLPPRLPPAILNLIAYYTLKRDRIPPLLDLLKSSLPAEQTTLNAIQNGYNNGLALGSVENMYSQVERPLQALMNDNMHHLLIRAAELGNEIAVEELLKFKNIDVNVAIRRSWGSRLREADCETPLIIASREGHHTVVSRLLMAAHILVNKPDSRGMTALMYAATSRSLPCLLLLLKHGNINVNAKDRMGDTALMKTGRCNTHLSQSILYMYRLMNEPSSKLSALVQQLNNEVDTKNASYIDNPVMTLGRLSIAVFYWTVSLPTNDEKILFLEKILSPEYAFRPHIDHDQLCLSRIQKLLSELKQGAEDAVINFISGLNCDLGSLLLDTAGAGHALAVQELLKIPGVNINERNPGPGWYQGWTPLMHASFHGWSDVVKVLISTPGIDLNVQGTSQDRHSALTLAATSGHDHAVSVLLNANHIDPNIQANTELPWTSIRGPETPLLCAVRNRHVATINVLLEVKNLDFDVIGACGRTALQILVESYYFNLAHQVCIRQLLKSPSQGADELVIKLRAQTQANHYFVFSPEQIRNHFFNTIRASRTRAERLELFQRALSPDNAFSVYMNPNSVEFSSIERAYNALIQGDIEQVDYSESTWRNVRVSPPVLVHDTSRAENLVGDIQGSAGMSTTNGQPCTEEHQHPVPMKMSPAKHTAPTSTNTMVLRSAALGICIGTVLALSLVSVQFLSANTALNVLSRVFSHIGVAIATISAGTAVVSGTYYAYMQSRAHGDSALRMQSRAHGDSAMRTQSLPVLAAI